MPLDFAAEERAARLSNPGTGLTEQTLLDCKRRELEERRVGGSGSNLSTPFVLESLRLPRSGVLREFGRWDLRYHALLQIGSEWGKEQARISSRTDARSSQT